MRAVGARRPFGPIWRFRAVLETFPASNLHSRLRSRKMGGSIYGRLIRNLGIFARFPAAITEAGEAERQTNNVPPRGALEGISGRFFFFNFNKFIGNEIYTLRGQGPRRIISPIRGHFFGADRENIPTSMINLRPAEGLPTHWLLSLPLVYGVWF